MEGIAAQPVLSGYAGYAVKEAGAFKFLRAWQSLWFDAVMAGCTMGAECSKLAQLFRTE
ncbi:hypothetical protein [Neisseria sp. 19428wB4_WF04]|uniref:hypothetical protein n=1 Tax=Neisseria sp. 19428wB4_WF04 TaxID=2782469 RepID=UPI0018839FD4|nr:hypothetical protein [Neisseria sp. 19428wB4_WF04]